VFLISNWHLAFLNLIMSASLGDEWSAYFDIIIAKADKPLFYKSQNFFCQLKPEKDEVVKVEIKTLQDMAES
jgi:hypothetical protein